jgi:CMP-N,N'-diacetyllegionaminic acid synthase
MIEVPTCLALIPARAGSKRIPGKNVRILAGHPLLAYTIRAAIQASVFDAVFVSTESEQIAEIAQGYGAEVPFLRPPHLAGDRSPDIEWVTHTLDQLATTGRRWDCFSILRPTSPFRTSATIERAWAQFLSDRQADSLRAVQLCREHPAKQWTIAHGWMRPVMENPDPTGVPWHSSPYQSLPPVYVQNASLEIAWTRVPLDLGSIAGNRVMPFITEGLEGFDINGPDDWILAESHASVLPSLGNEPRAAS